MSDNDTHSFELEHSCPILSAYSVFTYHEQVQSCFGLTMQMHVKHVQLHTLISLCII